MVCKNCGKENIDSIEKCIYCKQKLDSLVNENKATQAKAPNNTEIDNTETEINQIKNTETDFEPNKSEKSGCAGAFKIIAIFVTIICGIVIFKSFSTTCEGWACLGRAALIIFGFIGIIGIWILYGGAKLIDSYRKNPKKGKKLPKLITILYTIAIISIPILWVLRLTLFISIIDIVYGFQILVFLGISAYLLFRKGIEENSVLTIVLAVILSLCSITSGVAFVSSVYDYIKESKINNFKNNYDLLDMAESVCYGNASKVYSIDNYKRSGIFECDNNYSYYIEGRNEKCGYYTCGNIYEIGYSYHEKIEEQFENGIYFYRESRVTSYPSELKIVLEANSEEDLLNKYGEKLYNLAKDGNLDIMVYYNDKIDDVNTTYDKLSLLVFIYEVNVTQPSGMGTEYGEYAFYYTTPKETLNELLSDKANYPSDMRDAIKFHRHIRFESNGRTFETLEDFIEALKDSFEDGF